MNTDARKLSWNSLTDLRKRALASIQEGQNPSDVAKIFGIGRRTIYNWLSLYRNGGWGALDAHKRGGRPALLDGKKLNWIYKTVVDKNPLQMKLPFTLWTAKMIGTVIEKKYAIALSKASVCRLLNQLGITPQRPVWAAYQQKPEAVQKWLKTEYPKIRAKAKKEKGEIYFADEAGVRSDFHAGTTWAAKGKTPVIQTTGARFSFNVISAVNAQGEFRFMVVKGSVNSKVFCGFIKRLTTGTSKKVFLIVDGHPTHKSVAVRELLETLKKKIELHFLPPYSPELNPDERVWSDLKNNGVGRLVTTTPEQMKRNIISFLRFIQKTPQRVMSYFTDKHVAYAAT
jgi:transposase